jgi:hypothetical protein
MGDYALDIPLDNISDIGHNSIFALRGRYGGKYS